MLASEPIPSGRELDEARARFQQSGYALIHYDDDSIHSFPYDAPWLTDDGFNRLYKRVRKHTLVDRVRCHALYQLGVQARKVPGDILEVGVWRGGTAAILAHSAPEKIVYAADTFRGVVKASDWEPYKDGAHADTTREIVIELLERQMCTKNYVLLEGIFPEQTGSDVAGKTFSLVHIDVDVYASARDVFIFVWDNVAFGGIVVFDDYGFVSACPGVFRFVEELRRDNDKLFIPGPSGHGYIMKLPEPVQG